MILTFLCVSVCAGEFCLMRCHNIDVVRMTAQERESWVCPACHSLCFCAACQRYERQRAAERTQLEPALAAESLLHDVTHSASPSQVGAPYQALRVDTSSPLPSFSIEYAYKQSSPLTPTATLDYSLPSSPAAAFSLAPIAPVLPPRPPRALAALIRNQPQRPPPLQLPASSPLSSAGATAPLFSPVGSAGGASGRANESPFVPLLLSRPSPHPYFTFPALYPMPQLFNAPPHCSSSRTYSWSEIQG